MFVVVTPSDPLPHSRSSVPALYRPDQTPNIRRTEVSRWRGAFRSLRIFQYFVLLRCQSLPLSSVSHGVGVFFSGLAVQALVDGGYSAPVHVG